MAFGPFGGTYNGQKYAEANVPAYTLTDQQKEFMNKEHIRHVLMITVEDAKTAAKWNNELQKLAESMPHGIPGEHFLRPAQRCARQRQRRV